MHLFFYFGGNKNEMPYEIRMGKAYALPPAPRQGRNGRLDEACLPHSVS